MSITRSEGMSKLNLNWDLVNEARKHAQNIARDVQNFIDLHTTVTIERAVCRLLGIDGVKDEIPLPNIVVDHIKNKGNIGLGISYYLGNAMIETNLSPQEIAEKVANSELDLTTLPRNGLDKIKEKLLPVVKHYLQIIKNNRIKENN